MKTNIFPTTLKTVSLAALLTVSVVSLEVGAVSVSPNQCKPICDAASDVSQPICNKWYTSDQCSTMLDKIWGQCIDTCLETKLSPTTKSTK